MIVQRISQYLVFARQCLLLLAEQRLYFIAFICLSGIGALTEGLSISLLVPILETQTFKGSFSSVPILGTVLRQYDDFSPSELIAITSVFMAGVVLMRSVVTYSIDVLGTIIPIRLEEKFNLQSYAVLMAVEIGYINQKEYGTLLNSLGGWADRVSNMLTSVAVVVWNLMVATVYITMMVVISFKLTVIAVFFAFLLSLMLRYLTNNALHHIGRRLTAAATRLSQITMESLAGMKLIRLTTSEPEMTEKYTMALTNMIDTRCHMAKIQAITSPMMSGAAGLFICILLFTNAIMHGDGDTKWIGPLLVFLLLLFRLIGPVGNINTARVRIVYHMHAFNMLNDFFRETEERKQSSGNKKVKQLSKELSFEGVTFSYGNSNVCAISNFSATIKRGQMVAVVGPSGAGKSTLIALLARLYDPENGVIKVDGVDLRQLDIRLWRQQLAVVSQDIFIFNDTVANNISFGKSNVPREKVEAAARLAAASDFIEHMPNGYDTLLGDRGVRLSGGQQQRISIARAIVASPDILIFDEATSSLDTFTERAIQSAIEYMAKGRTLIVIAHRLSTIRSADKVIVMENGQIVEEGKHNELLERRGAYWEMVEHQRLDLVEEDDELAMKESRS